MNHVLAAQRTIKPVMASFDAVGGFPPASVIAWWDISRLSTLFQDSAGLTPVSATNDPVGLVKNRISPGTYDLSQALLSKKALYKTNVSKGLPGILFDGSDDFLSFSALTSGTSFSFFIAVLPLLNARDYGTIFTAGSTSGFWRRGLGENARKISFYYSGTDHHNNTPLADNAVSLYGMVVSNGAGTHYLNGSTDGTCSLVPSMYFTRIGDDGGDMYKGYLLEAIFCNTALTSGDISNVFSYLNRWL